jgi:hypothetical protein
MADTSFKMTKELAEEIRILRQNGSTWRMVATRFHEMHPDLKVTSGHQLEGMCLCEEAGKVLKENHYEW